MVDLPTPSTPRITRAPRRISRAQALYNSERRQYVLLFALSSRDYSVATVGYASSVGPFGPFKWELAAMPDDVPSFDIGVAQDGADGAAYLVGGEAAGQLPSRGGGSEEG
jgi:hypothetical protein